MTGRPGAHLTEALSGPSVERGTISGVEARSVTKTETKEDGLHCRPVFQSAPQFQESLTHSAMARRSVDPLGMCKDVTPALEDLFVADLVEPFLQYVRDVAEMNTAPEIPVALSTLVLYSSALGTCSIVYHGSFTSPNSLWLTMVQPTGSRKSPVLNAARELWEDATFINQLWYQLPECRGLSVQLLPDGAFTGAGLHRLLMVPDGVENGMPRLLYFCEERLQLFQSVTSAQAGGNVTSLPDFLKLADGRPSARTLLDMSQSSKPVRFNLVAGTQVNDAKSSADTKMTASGFVGRFSHFISESREFDFVGHTWSNPPDCDAAAEDLARISRLFGSKRGVIVALSTQNGSRLLFETARDDWARAATGKTPGLNLGEKGSAIMSKAPGLCLRFLAPHAALLLTCALRRQHECGSMPHDADAPEVVRFGDLDADRRGDLFIHDPKARGRSGRTVSVYPIVVEGPANQPNPDLSRQSLEPALAGHWPGEGGSRIPKLGDVELYDDTPVIVANRASVVSAIATTRMVINHNLLVVGDSPFPDSIPRSTLHPNLPADLLMDPILRAAAWDILALPGKSVIKPGGAVDRRKLSRNHKMNKATIDRVGQVLGDVGLIDVVNDGRGTLVRRQADSMNPVHSAIFRLLNLDIPKNNLELELLMLEEIRDTSTREPGGNSRRITENQEDEITGHVGSQDSASRRVRQRLASALDLTLH